MLELAAGGCAVEVHLNGMPLAALGPAGGSTSLAVHEYTLAGRNELTLSSARPRRARRGAEPASRRDRSHLGAGASGARPPGPVAGRSRGPRPRRRRVGDDRRAAPTTRRRRTSARSIFRSTSRAGAGSTRRRSSSAIRCKRAILEFLQQLAVELGRGNPEPLIAASKLRFDELAVAYQSDAAVAVQRFRDHVQGLYAAKALKVLPPVADELVLRPLVDGRLIECLAPTGGPALRTSNDAPELGEQAWPIRLAMVEGRIYVLR